MKASPLILLFLLLALVAHSQKVYQIKADTLRIYNMCDTAELVLENRTKDTLGFLFNKGKGRTEFRKLHLAMTGTNNLTIPGQDTLDMSAWGDGRYDLKSTNFLSLADSSITPFAQWPVNKAVGYYIYQGNDMPKLSSQAFQSVGKTNYFTGLVVRNNLTGFDMAVNWDGELLGPNGVFFRIKDDTKSQWSAWREVLFKDYADNGFIRNQLASPQAAGFYINGESNTLALKTFNGEGKAQWAMFGGTFKPEVSSNIRWSHAFAGVETGNNTGSNYAIYRYNDVGALLNAPIRIARASGVVTMADGFLSGNNSGILGTGTTVNQSILRFMKSDGLTRDGWVGLGNPALKDVYLASDSGNVVLTPNYANPKGSLTVQPSTLNYDGGSLVLSNPNTNNILFSNVGFASPSMVTRSAGTKIILSAWLGASSGDYAIGVEPNQIWQSVPTNSNGLGFKFYGGITAAARLGGAGLFETAGQGRFKGWYDGSSAAYNLAGPAAEIGTVIGAGTTTATVIGFDRTANNYIPLAISGGTTVNNQRTFTIDGTGYKFQSLLNATVVGTDANGYLVSTPVSTAISANTIAQRDASSALYASGFFQSSKASLKKDIADFNEDALALLMKVRIKQFIYKDDPAENLRLGIIADNTDWHFATKSHDKFDTNSSLAITMKAIQELYQENQQFKKDNQQLRQENDELKTKLEVLLQRVEAVETQIKKNK